MTNRRVFIPSILLFLFLLNPNQLHAASHPGETVHVSRESILDVAKELHPPGCTDSMTADYCMLYSAYDLRDEIKGMFAQGMNKEQVIDGLVQKYGDRILAAPPTEGFHWLAWVMPGTAVTGGVLLIGSLIYVWVRKSQGQPLEGAESGVRVVSEEKRLQVQEELNKWL